MIASTLDTVPYNPPRLMIMPLRTWLLGLDYYDVTMLTDHVPGGGVFGYHVGTAWTQQGAERIGRRAVRAEMDRRTGVAAELEAQRLAAGGW